MTTFGQVHRTQWLNGRLVEGGEEMRRWSTRNRRNLRYMFRTMRGCVLSPTRRVVKMMLKTNDVRLSPMQLPIQKGWMN